MRQPKGFTLTELLISVAIIGIISSIAIPMYSEQIAKTSRKDAQGALLQFQNAMERYYAEQSPYTYRGAGASGDDTGSPGIFSTEAPLHGTDKYYDLKITAASSTTYTLSAVPKNRQDDDRCGTLTVNNTGEKTSDDTNCW
ncbi:MAG: pilus assembly protein PilE [Gammaproteobacteria bacterium]|nr:MAG: pilus assembly protein PilE [Gammaproteobacteria bacterium]